MILNRLFLFTSMSLALIFPSCDSSPSDVENKARKSRVTTLDEDDTDIEKSSGYSQMPQEYTGYEIAVIDDPDGYTNIREGRSVQSSIIAKIYDGEKFLVKKEEGNWFPVVLEAGTEGYIYFDRVRFLEEPTNGEVTDARDSQSPASSAISEEEINEATNAIIGALLGAKRQCRCCGVAFLPMTGYNEYGQSPTLNGSENCSSGQTVFCSDKCYNTSYHNECQ
jgi:hypothetical protein